MGLHHDCEYNCGGTDCDAPESPPRQQVASNGLLSGNQQSCYVYAARYAHSRNTGAAMQVVNTILNLWDQFDYRNQQQLKKEAREAVFNKEDWQLLIDR